MWEEILRASIALFVIVDPLGNMPIFISLTSNIDVKKRKHVLNVATLTAALLLIIFALIGQQLLAFFNISLQSFMIAGGILLLIIAVRILVAGEWTEKVVYPDEVGAVPFAFPLLAGPGAITTTIVTMQTTNLLVALVSIGIVSIASWIIFRLIDRIYSILGRTGLAIIARLMAVFIAAIAIQYLITGLKSYF